MTESFSTDNAKARLYRHAPDWDGQRTAAIGNFSAKSAEAGADLLAEMEARARTLGTTALIGPMDGTTWNSYRLVTDSDGSKPFLMEPTSGPHDLAAFERAGFAPISTYFSARLRLADFEDDPGRTHDGIEIRAWDGTDPEATFGTVYDLSLQAFAGNAFYTPIAREAFVAMYLPMIPMIRPELVFFAYADGAPTGFLFGIPNYAEGPKPATAILKTYASLKPGAGHLLSRAFHATTREAGFDTVIHALIHEDNLSGLRSAQHGAQIFRRYALMGKRLAPA